MDYSFMEKTYVPIHNLSVLVEVGKDMKSASPFVYRLDMQNKWQQHK